MPEQQAPCHTAATKVQLNDTINCDDLFFHLCLNNNINDSGVTRPVRNVSCLSVPYYYTNTKLAVTALHKTQVYIAINLFALLHPCAIQRTWNCSGGKPAGVPQIVPSLAWFAVAIGTNSNVFTYYIG